MGIDVHGLRFIEYVFRTNGPIKSTLTIGHQGLHVSKKELQDYLGIPDPPDCFVAPYVDDLLLEQFGATAVASIDASDYEEATYVRDLNIFIEPDFPKFDSVIDAGSLEHVFDIRTSFANISRCCKVGGQIVHISPANNFVGHGFYQFSPEFFFSLYSEVHGFAETEVYLADLGRPNVWWKVAAPSGASRSTAVSPHETYALVRTKKISEVAGTSPVQQSDYVSMWQSSEDADGAPSSLSSRGRLMKLSDQLPTHARAKLVQMKRRASWGMHSRNQVLIRVRPPSPRPHGS